VQRLNCRSQESDWRREKLLSGMVATAFAGGWLGAFGRAEELIGSEFAAFLGVFAPGEDGSGDPVFGAARVLVNGGLKLGENLNEFVLLGGADARAQSANAIFNAPGGMHRRTKELRYR